MHENFELVQRGLRTLLYYMSERIGYEMVHKYGDRWWDEVLYALNDQRDLPYRGEYNQLLDSLDVLNCLRLIERRWNEVFAAVLHRNARTWARELMGVRNEIAHLGQQDYPLEMTERALNTMLLLCRELDAEGAEEIEELYLEARSKAGAVVQAVAEYSGLAQPASESRRGALKEDSLLLLNDPAAVEKTTLTRKVTYGGKTVVYPVYRVRLDLLYYNDLNDRISTWISRYEAENGKQSLQSADNESYNRIIEGFIYDSNPEAIRKTQTNIALVGQREPGVTLADGRIVDGNRRFTCLRRLQQETDEPLYFETVIMDMDIREDRKQIKLLELAIQHGEEKKVDYDKIDFAIGTYRDVVQTGLLTVEEYAEGANEPAAEVRKRIEIAEIICEFLEYLHLPEQYHAAREYQVYDLFQEMMPPLKKLQGTEKSELKQITFNNVMMKAVRDQRKFIRDIKTLVKNDSYRSYFDDQKRIGEEIIAGFAEAAVSCKADVDRFAEEHKTLAQRLQSSMETAMLRTRSAAMKNKPAEVAAKCVGQLSDVDTRLLARLGEEDKAALLAELDELELLVSQFRKLLS